jgi:hypothetical protein
LGIQKLTKVRDWVVSTGVSMVLVSKSNSFYEYVRIEVTSVEVPIPLDKSSPSTHTWKTFPLPSETPISSRPKAQRLKFAKPYMVVCTQRVIAWISAYLLGTSVRSSIISGLPCSFTECHIAIMKIFETTTRLCSFSHDSYVIWIEVHKFGLIHRPKGKCSTWFVF